MSTTPRPPRILHATSEPYRFFGRRAELALLKESVEGGPVSVVALIGPGGQGKTATLQHWLTQLAEYPPDGLFFWSFYRAKNSDLCLRELHAYATGADSTSDVAASWCVDHLVPILRRERWAVILDGTEVVQHESGPWFGRLLHPELARLIEELATVPQPGVLVLTSRFPLPGLELRRHAEVIQLAHLDAESARGLLRSLGAHGDDSILDAASAACGRHAKAVELLGTYLVRFANGDASAWKHILTDLSIEDADAEQQVARVLGSFQTMLPAEAQDILALATAFREPPREARLLEYLRSAPVETLLQDTWQRSYSPFAARSVGWLAGQLAELIGLRLLERVGGSTGGEVIDAHPLVRRAFEHVRGLPGQRASALARAGFLRGRPDRRRPETLAEAREKIELFHAHCTAGLWNEADSTFLALENPKHRLLAPACERDLLLQFFPGGDWTQPPLWSGFGRYRSLAICFEMLGQFEEALAAYQDVDAPLRGDALIALGRLEPLLNQPHAPPPWQPLWSAYRAHALALAGRPGEALELARTLVPVDIYEWLHVFECLLRLGRLDLLDLKSLLYRPPQANEHPWAELARRRMQADYDRLIDGIDVEAKLTELVEAYDRAGLPYERCLTRLSLARLLRARGKTVQADEVNRVTLELARRHGMRFVEMDALDLHGETLNARP